MRVPDSLARIVGAKKPAAAPSFREAQAARSAEDFEAVFLSQMLEHMFSGIETPEMFGGGTYAEEVYQSLMVDEYGKILARSGGIGVADHVKRELLSLQEAP